MFINGFLAVGVPTGLGAFTEFSGPGYARQPISFGEAVDGVSYNSCAYTFCMTVRGFSGRAIYDAPSGGNLLLVMPFPTPFAQGRLPWDAADAGTIRLVFTALQPYHQGAAYSGSFPPATVIGSANDNYDIVNAIGPTPLAGLPIPTINTAPLSTGVGVTLTRGILAKT